MYSSGAARNGSTTSDLAVGPTVTALIAGTVAAVCAFLPWITAQSSYQDANGSTTTTSISWSGVDSQVLDGWYALMLGGMAAVIELTVLLRQRDGRQAQGMVEMALAAVLLALGARYIAALSAADTALSWLHNYVSVGAGAGLWLMETAAVVIAVAGITRIVAGFADIEPARVWSRPELAVPSLAPRWSPPAQANPPEQRRPAGVARATSLLGVAFGGVNNSVAVGPLGRLAHSEDGGRTWTALVEPDWLDHNAVAMANNLDGWTVGSQGVILRTSDGGRTWEQDLSPTRQELHAVACTSSLTAWAVGAGGTIVHTTDGGVTWSVQASGVSRAFGWLAMQERSSTPPMAERPGYCKAAAQTVTCPAWLASMKRGRG